MQTAGDLLIINTGQCHAHTHINFKYLDAIKIDGFPPPFLATI